MNPACPGLFEDRKSEKFGSPVGCQGQKPLEKAEVSLAAMRLWSGQKN
jgi:hypothetical protein